MRFEYKLLLLKRPFNLVKELARMLMNLSKACDCLPHHNLISKFASYSFNKMALCLATDYVTTRQQRAIKIGSIFSYYLETLKNIL